MLRCSPRSLTMTTRQKVVIPKIPSAPSEKCIMLKPSSNPLGKPTFYISRMHETHAPPGVFRANGLGPAEPLFVITSPSCEYYSLRLPLLRSGFRRFKVPQVPIAANLLWGRSIPLREAKSADGSRSVLQPARPPGEAPESYLRSLRMENRFQKFNHFPLSHRCLGCKQGLTNHFRRIVNACGTNTSLRRAVRQKYSFLPKSWMYPAETETITRALTEATNSSHFIWKPARGSCGRGICLCRAGSANERSWRQVMAQINEKAQDPETSRMYSNYVVQRYIENPLLLNGRKTDLRLYVAVTAYDTLTVYLHEEGLVRLAAEPYHKEEPTSGSTADGATNKTGNRAGGNDPHSGRFRHLTNYSVGRRYRDASGTLAKAGQGSEPGNSSNGGVSAVAGNSTDAIQSSTEVPQIELKWSLDRFWEYLDTSAPVAPGRLSTSARVKERISLLIVRTLMTVKSDITDALRRVETPGSYFELYGFDVMLDTELNPFLLEVNTLPSLESSSQFDHVTKSNVVSDLVNIALVQPFERESEQLAELLRGDAGAAKSGSETPAAEVANAASSALAKVTVSPEARRWINSAEETNTRLDKTSSEDLSAKIKETRFRLQDELTYARGFRRIFPPVTAQQAAELGESFPITLPHTELEDDISTYKALGLLSETETALLSLQ